MHARRPKEKSQKFTYIYNTNIIQNLWWVEGSKLVIMPSQQTKNWILPICLLFLSPSHIHTTVKKIFFPLGHTYQCSGIIPGWPARRASPSTCCIVARTPRDIFHEPSKSQNQCGPLIFILTGKITGAGESAQRTGALGFGSP